MPLFTLLDTTIGLVLVFSLLSLLVSAIAEAVSQIFAWRGRELEHGVAGMITDPALREKLFLHPLIHSLGRTTGSPGAARSRANWRPPSYIPTTLFVAALIDTLHRHADAARGEQDGSPSDESPDDESPDHPIGEAIDTSFDELRAMLGRLHESDARDALIALADSGERNMNAVRNRFGEWFDRTMDRTSDWYHRRMRTLLLLISTIFVVALNLDAVRMAHTLWASPALREQAVVAAREQAADPLQDAATRAVLAERVRALGEIGLPLGWEDDLPGDASQALTKLFGLLITVFAASLGANFWYDVLKKLIRVRDARPPSPA